MEEKKIQKNTAVRILKKDKSFLESLVNAGYFATLSEANRAGIRLLKSQYEAAA